MPKRDCEQEGGKLQVGWDVEEQVEGGRQGGVGQQGQQGQVVEAGGGEEQQQGEGGEGVVLAGAAVG